MGLDSVELIMRFEKEFKTTIPDQDAENIATVGNVANWFFQHLPIQQPDKKVKDSIFSALKDAFAKLGLNSDFEDDHILGDYLPKDNLPVVWKDLARELSLKIPALNPQDLTDEPLKPIKILGLSLSTPKPPLLAMNFYRLVECIGALNYRNLVDFDQLSSLFEITIAIIGITSEQCGLDVDEVFVESSFGYDLGID